METSKSLQVLQSLPVRGAIVGLCATQALDAVSILLYENEDPRRRFAENATRGWLHAYERAVVRMADAFDVDISRRQAETWGWRFHKTFGVVGGIAYVAARRRSPRVGRWGGLGFGAAFFGLVDEVLVPLLGWTPGPQKFSWRVHARGAISHLAYGVAAEMSARVLDRGLAWLARGATDAVGPGGASRETAAHEASATPLPHTVATAPRPRRHPSDGSS